MAKPADSEANLDADAEQAIELTEEDHALKRAILSKFRGIHAKSKSELEELLEELVRLNIK